MPPPVSVMTLLFINLTPQVWPGPATRTLHQLALCQNAGFLLQTHLLRRLSLTAHHQSSSDRGLWTKKHNEGLSNSEGRDCYVPTLPNLPQRSTFILSRVGRETKKSAARPPVSFLHKISLLECFLFISHCLAPPPVWRLQGRELTLAATQKGLRRPSAHSR